MAGEPQEALKAYSTALNYNYKNSRVYNNIGLAFASMHKYDEAFEAFKKSVGEAKAYNNLGCLYLNLGKYKDAIHCFEKALEVSLDATNILNSSFLKNTLNPVNSGLSPEKFCIERILR